MALNKMTLRLFRPQVDLDTIVEATSRRWRGRLQGFGDNVTSVNIKQKSPINDWPEQTAVATTWFLLFSIGNSQASIIAMTWGSLLHLRLASVTLAHPALANERISHSNLRVKRVRISR